MMSDMHTHWIDRLSDFMDGTLGADEAQAVEEHLGQCPDCARVLAELREVVDVAHGLGEVPPARDLWPDIAARLGSRPGERAAEVIPLPTGGRPTPHGLFLSRWQLAAAAAVVALISAGATWALGPGLAVRPVGVPLAMPAAVTPAANVEGPPPALADELSRLQATLDQARDQLDPNTVRILEKNLNVIDRAIQDCRRALAADPGNAFLKEHLERAYEQKASYLREATNIVGWSG